MFGTIICRSIYIFFFLKKYTKSLYVERISGNICRNFRKIIRNHKKLFKLGIFGLFVSQFEFFFFLKCMEILYVEICVNLKSLRDVN